MYRILGGLLLCCLAFSTPQSADDRPSLSLRQLSEPGEPAALLRPGRRQALEIELEARFDCPVGSHAEHLFVSVADESVLTTAPRSPQPIRLSLPASRQVAIRGRPHCSGTGPLRLQSQLTAYASLLCREGQQYRSITTSTALDVWYACPETGED